MPKRSQTPPKYPNYLREQIHHNGLTLNEVAQETDIPLRSLSDYCSAKLRIPRQRLEELSCIISCTPQDIVPKYEPREASTKQNPFYWNIPYPRNPFFTGREEVLTRLHEMLNREKAVVALAQQALCGLGGIGKTQTVLEYIYRYKSEYQAVFWIKADTRENLFADFLSLAQLLALPERDAQDQMVATAAMKRWLQEHIGWLLVFDNVDDLEMVREVLPTGCQGHVLLTTGLQQLAVASSEMHQLRFNEAIGSLLRFSLVRRNGDTHTISVHRLIQSVVRDNLLPENQSAWIQRVVHLLSEAFPPAVEVTIWPTCEKFLPHALLCVHWIELAHIPSLKAASLLNTIGYYLNMRARYEIAMPLFQRALRIREHVLGKLHSDTAQTLSNQAVTIRKHVLGTKHLHTTQSMNALALLYRDQGEYEKAELLFLEVLAIREQILGGTHLRTVTSLHNLALLYYNQGKFEQAEHLFYRALTLREHLFGREHPRTLVILNNLTRCQNSMQK